VDEISEADGAAVTDAAGWTVSWLAADGEASRPVAEAADVGFEAVAAVREFPVVLPKLGH
jgi:hypothetical protein